MIIRIIAIDPQGVNKERGTDVLVYQVPEKSRELEVLTACFDKWGIEWALIAPTKNSRILAKEPKKA